MGSYMFCVGAVIRRSAWIGHGEPKSLRIYSMAVSVPRDFCAPPGRRQIAQER